MDSITVVPWVATAVTLLVAVFTGWVGIRTKRSEHELALERDRFLAGEQERQRELERRRDLVTPVLESLLYSTSELQSRLYNIITGGLAYAFARGAKRHRRSVIEYTCFVFAQYFGWVEALRRTVLLGETSSDPTANRLSLGDATEDGNVTIALITREISDALRADPLDPGFLLLNGEQHSIGALMFRWEDLGDRRVPSVMRFAEFATLYRTDGDFREWFAGIEEGLSNLESTSSKARLRRIQSLAVLLMDQLDPGHIVFKKRDPLEPRGELDALFNRYRDVPSPPPSTSAD